MLLFQWFNNIVCYVMKAVMSYAQPFTKVKGLDRRISRIEHAPTSFLPTRLRDDEDNQWPEVFIKIMIN